MAWLNNTAAKIYLTIQDADGNDVDYSNELTSAQITDGSAINTGAVLTGGSINLTELPGNSRLEDYNQRKFGRGRLVLIDIEINGDRQRHPRGWLYVLGSTYNMEARTLSMEVGCILTMHNITDEIGDLDQYTVFPLTANDEEVATFKNLLSAVNTEGKFLWQNNLGQIKKDEFFKGDGLGSFKEEAKFVSVRDYTCLQVSPLGSSNVVPDTIKVGYTWQTEVNTPGDEDPTTGKPQEEDTTESTYFLEHPANLRRKQQVCTTDPQGNRTCKEIMVNTAKRQYSVTKTSSSIRRYGAIGGSVSTENEITRGPAVELAGSYYAELYAFNLAQNNYNPSGVNPAGLDEVVQSSRERTYEYGTGGEVLKQIEKSYKNVLSAMTPNDWRAGNAETGVIFDPEEPPTGATRGFLTSPPKTSLFLHTQTTVEYTYYDDRTVQVTTTLTSSAGCNGVGIYPPTGERILQNIGADNNGIETVQKRTSTGGLLNPDQPPRNPGGKTLETKSGVYIDESAKYYPTEAGSVTLTTSVPFAVVGASENAMRTYASNYAKVLRNQLEGDAAGIRVAESMRPEIFQYSPGMPFSFYDTTLEKLVKLRMNSTGWAMAPGQAIFSTDGVFIGISNGTVEIPENVDAVTIADLAREFGEAKKEYEEVEVEYEEADQDCEDKNAFLDAIAAEIYDRIPKFTYDVRVAPPPWDIPDQIFHVATTPPPPPPEADQVFVVTSVNQTFIVTNGPPADEIFDVTVAEP